MYSGFRGDLNESDISDAVFFTPMYLKLNYVMCL